MLVRLLTSSAADVPDKRKTGETKLARPDLSRNKETH